MRKAIKIGLIALAVAGIGALIWFTLLYQENNIKQVNVNDSYFTAQIKTQCDKKITRGRSFNDIMRSYNTMLQEVEDAIYLENINDTEATNCRKLLAYGYAPKLTSYAKEYFNGSNWNVLVIDTLRHEARNLINASILPNDSHDLPKLRDIIKTVDDYHAALAATHIGSISSVSAAKSAISRANSYKHAPLTNCRSLVAELNAVPQKAKSSLVQNILSACQRHSGSTDALIARIDEYQRAFEYNSQLAQERQRLLAAKENARERQVREDMNKDNGNFDEEIK